MGFFHAQIHRGRRLQEEKNELKNFALHHQWPHKYLHTILEAAPAHALIITNPLQQICWVNQALLDMTGYPSTAIIGHTPRLFQGAATDATIKTQIKKAIEQQQPVAATLINYRKNGEPYYCNIRIIPVFNKHCQLSHFMAFEKEIYPFSKEPFVI